MLVFFYKPLNISKSVGDKNFFLKSNANFKKAREVLN